MKTRLIILLLVMTFSGLPGQNYYRIVFAGNPDFIFVENITQDKIISVQGTDTLLLKLKVTGVQEAEKENHKLIIFPNPMDQSCSFEFENTKPGRVSVMLFNTNGGMVHRYSDDLPQGTQSFRISGVPSGVYAIIVNTKTYRYTGRFVSTDKSGTGFSMINKKETDEKTGNVESGNGYETNDIWDMPLDYRAMHELDFAPGDKLKFLGYSSYLESEIVFASPSGDQTITFSFCTRPAQPSVISGNSNPCQGTTGLTYSVNKVSGVTYTWTVPSGWSITSGQGTNSITVTSGTQPGNISVTPSNNCGNGPANSFAVTTQSVPATPTAGSHVPSQTQIVWNWNVSAGAAGYKYNTVNNYATATDNGSSNTYTQTGLTCNTAYTLYVWAYNACGNSSSTQLSQSTSPCVFICGTSTVTFTYNGSNVTYGTVTSANNRCWLDRNLGASKVAASSTDAAAYGDLFQWGRLADGHQLRTSATTSTLSNTDVPGHGNFILATSSPYDWRSPQNNNLWQGEGGTNNPCPDGFRLPTNAEWDAERASWSSQNADGAFASSLKLTLAGNRYFDGLVIYDGFGGRYWSSTVGDNNAWRLYFSSNSAYMHIFNRAAGVSVRCLKDCDVPAQPSAISGNSNPCQASTGLIYSVNKVSGVTYTWTVPSGWSITSGQGTNSITVTSGTQPGNISVTPSNNCGNGPSNLFAVTTQSVPATPTAGTQVPSQTQIVWNWNTSVGATGYKYNTVNNYATATDNGTSPTYTQTGLTCNTAYSLYVWAYNICGNSASVQLSQTTSTCVFICGTSTVTFTYNGSNVTYGTVTSANSRCWLDRNLGASKVAASSTDAAAYGDLFQWGRLADGHQVRTSPTTTTLSNSDVPGHGNFIKVSSNPFDWRSPQNNNLWQGVNGKNNPCPTGYRPPTDTEWNTERLSWSTNNAAGAFASPLKLPMAGVRDYFDGSVDNEDSGVIYWSSKVNGINTWTLVFDSNGAFMDSRSRALGMSVRCLKDCDVPAQPSSINGNSNPCQGETGLIYSVTNVTGLTYTWIVPSGWTITAGQGTNSITVTAGSSENNIIVTPSNTCGSGTQRTLAVASQIIPDQPSAITGNNNPCQGATGLNYSVTDVAGVTYSWTVPSGWTITSGQGNSSITVTAGTAAGNISVVPSNDCGNGPANSLAVATNTVPSQPSAISGNNNPCQGATGLSYSVTNVAGVTYTWTVPSGWSITAGQGTNNITVTTGSASGNIAVTPSNTCGSGTQRTLAVSAQTVPAQPSTISGNNNPCQGATGLSYSVTNVAGVTYTWTVPSGWSITAGQGTNNITVTTGSASGNIAVTPSNTCGSGTQRTLAVSTQTVPAQPSTISGNNNPCQGATGLSYSVTNVSGVTYTWTVPSGWAITAGQSTNNITVTAGSASGNIAVTPSNTCGNGTQRTLAVTTQTVPAQPSTISGNNNPCQGATGLSYSVTNVAGVTYTWTVPSGWTITSGQGTSNITVTAGSALGNISVTPSNTCGNGPANSLAVTSQAPPSQPTAGIHVPSQTQIVWNWNTSAGATGYKYNTINNYSTATNNGTSTTYTQTGLTCGTVYTLYVWAYNTCGNSTVQILTQSTNSCCGSPVTFTYNGSTVTYGTVTSANNRCWLDRNLGAAQVATSSTDAASYGDLFQWGRLDDGHQVRTSGTTTTLSNSDVPGHNLFIKVTANPYDWRSPQNDNLWQGEAGTNNPCPEGYRLPTQVELDTERLSWSSNNAAGAFASPLKLPMAGSRWYLDGTVGAEGLNGYYWSSTVFGYRSDLLYFSSGNAYTGQYYRAYGLSVRCIKD